MNLNQAIGWIEDDKILTLPAGTTIVFGDSMDHSTRYGLRDNAGVMESMDSGGAWGTKTFNTLTATYGTIRSLFSNTFSGTTVTGKTISATTFSATYGSILTAVANTATVTYGGFQEVVSNTATVTYGGILQVVSNTATITYGTAQELYSNTFSATTATLLSASGTTFSASVSRVQGANGQLITSGMVSQLVSTVAGTTVNTTIQLPASSIILGVSARVTVTCSATATNFTLIGVTSGHTFTNTFGVNAGDTVLGQDNCPYVSGAAEEVQLLADDVCEEAGRVRVVFNYITLTAPTS